MRAGVRPRLVRRRGRLIRPLGWAAVAALLALSVVGPAGVGAAGPPAPTHGSAVVDGATGDWSLGADKFADMTDAGNADKPVVARLYLRYDCDTRDAVRARPRRRRTQFLQTRPENAYIRIDGVGKLVSGLSGNDGTPPDFSWVNPDGTLTDGCGGVRQGRPREPHRPRPRPPAGQPLGWIPEHRQHRARGPARARVRRRDPDPDPDAHAHPDG